MKTLTIRNPLFGMALAVAVLGPPTTSVEGIGTLVNGNDAPSVTHIGTGRYEVTFTSVVSDCA